MATKKTIITKDQIVSMYMNYVLEHSEKPMIFPKRNSMPFLAQLIVLRKKFSKCL